MDEIEYHRFSVKYGTFFEAGIGAEAIYKIFKDIKMEKLAAELELQLEKAGAAEREKLNKRLSLVKSMIAAGVRPEWMFIDAHPDHAAGIASDGRFGVRPSRDLGRQRSLSPRHQPQQPPRENCATSRRPRSSSRNEKRILQEAVDALLDNTIRRGGAAFSAQSQAQRRPLKSLADYLKSKQGYSASTSSASASTTPVARSSSWS